MDKYICDVLDGEKKIMPHLFWQHREEDSIIIEKGSNEKQCLKLEN